MRLLVSFTLFAACFSATILFTTSLFAASPIADAIQNKNNAALRTLIQQKADVNEAQADGSTALHWAAHWDDSEAVTLLLQAGAKVDAANRFGATPLFLAAQNGNAKMVARLLDAGADSNAPVMAHAETALMMAARSGNQDTVRALLDHGAHVNAVETLRGTTAVMWAAEQGHAVIVKLLAEKGADLRAQSKIINPPRRRGLAFAPPNAPGPPAVKGGLTPLLFAVREAALECVKILVAAGADVNQTSVDGSAPLLVAAQNGLYDVAAYLLDHGANPNQTNEKGWSPLYLAVKNRNHETTAVPAPSSVGSLEFIQLLLQHGADPNVRIKTETEVHQAMTAVWLKEAGATPLLRAALCGDLTTVRLLLEHQADPLIPTFDKTTPLMAAAGVGWADGLIHEYSADQTVELVKLLLERGADIRAANDHGITALHGAAYKGANRVVQLLVDRGADLAAQDKGEDYGFGASSAKMTPLNWAEGVPIGMSSAIFHDDTVALITRLMNERGIPVVTNKFHGQKPLDSKAIGEQ